MTRHTHTAAVTNSPIWCSLSQWSCSILQQLIHRVCVWKLILHNNANTKFQAQILKLNRRETDIWKFVWERLWRYAIQQVLKGANFNIRWTDGQKLWGWRGRWAHQFRGKKSCYWDILLDVWYYRVSTKVKHACKLRIIVCPFVEVFK